MLIDCHTHIGPYFNSTVDDLLRSMDEAKIDKSLVFAGEIWGAPNEWLFKQVAQHKDRLFAVAAAHPMKHSKMSGVQEEAVNIAKWYQDDLIVACKFYVGYDHYYPSDKVASEYLMEMEDVGCPAIFHMGDCLNTVQCAKLKYSHPLGIDEVAVDYPGMNFIIAHMGYPWHRDAAEVCYKNNNVYADISGFVYGDFTERDIFNFDKTLKKFLEICTHDKLLFATDYPISNQSAYIKTMKELGWHTELMTRNAIKAFNLEIQI